MQHHNPCRNPPSPSPEEPYCALDLSRTDSFSSAVTADDSSAPGPSTEWTDEKHRRYIQSLETSFVDQLHNSIALRGSLQKILYSNRTDYSGSLHQHGKRRKTNPRKNDLSLESTADSHIIECDDKNGGESSPFGSLEVSDQNFVEEMSNCWANKRLKRVRTDELSNHQVTLYTNYAPTSHLVSSVKDQKDQQLRL